MREDARGALRLARARHAGDQLSRDAVRVLADDAAYGLARVMPELSAHIVATPWQKIALSAFAALGLGIAIAYPATAWLLLTGAASLAFVAGTVFRAGLALLAVPKVSNETRPPASNLPAYTIIVPLYREANVLPRLARAMLQLDYPQDRLDIKLVVEEDDLETVGQAYAQCNRGPFELVVVPRGEPRTKPRACNYALARLRFLSVFREAAEAAERAWLFSPSPSSLGGLSGA